MAKKLLKTIGKVPYPESQANPEVPSPNPKEGRTLSYGKIPAAPDCSAGFEYPTEFPCGADEQIECSIFGKNENEKTYGQYRIDKKGD